MTFKNLSKGPFKTRPNIDLAFKRTTDYFNKW